MKLKIKENYTLISHIYECVCACMYVRELLKKKKANIKFNIAILGERPGDKKGRKLYYTNG